MVSLGLGSWLRAQTRSNLLSEVRPDVICYFGTRDNIDVECPIVAGATAHSARNTAVDEGASATLPRKTYKLCITTVESLPVGWLGVPLGLILPGYRKPVRQYLYDTIHAT